MYVKYALLPSCTPHITRIIPSQLPCLITVLKKNKNQVNCISYIFYGGPNYYIYSPWSYAPHPRPQQVNILLFSLLLLLLLETSDLTNGILQSSDCQSLVSSLYRSY